MGMTGRIFVITLVCVFAFCILFAVFSAVFQGSEKAFNERAKAYPVGSLVQHKLNTTTGIIVGYNGKYICVRFPSEYAGVQAAVDCLPIELTKIEKNILENKVEKE